MGSPEATDPAAARRSRRTEVRRAQIVDAAAELFAEVGYGPATLDAVGERVGLSKASLYYYVKSKEDLLGLIMLDALDAIGEHYEAQATGLTNDPAAKLRALARSHAGVACRTPGGRLMSRQGDLRDRAAALAHTDGRYRGLITGLVAEGVATGRFRRVDDEVFGWTFMLALNDIASWWTPAHARTPEDIAEEIVGYLLDGLRI